jgi:hypothetical protein
VVCIHNEVLSSHKKNDILSFAAKWMEPEDIILSEIIQMQKDKFYMLSLICICFLKIVSQTGHQWLTRVILVTQEAEIRRIMV